MSNDLLGEFLSGFLWVDDEWLVRGETAGTYWQHRLAQHIQVSEASMGRLHWQVDTVVVQDVADADLANELCMELNDWTAGWSFAYNASRRSIHALCSVSALPVWDRYLLRLSEAAKLSSWMSDRVAERLAEQVGGLPAFSYPEHQQGLRQVPDALYSLMDVIRERPEWVADSTPVMYPDSAAISTFFAAQMLGTADEVTVDDGEIWLTTLAQDRTSVSSQVHCAFLRSSLFGMAWVSEVLFPGAATLAAPEQVRSLVWEMFDSPECNLLGGWQERDRALVYSQVTLTGELRSMERLSSFVDTDAPLLWGITSTLSDAVSVNVRAEDDIETMRAPRRVGRDRRENAARHVLDALCDGAQLAVEHVPTVQDDRADRRLLWLQPSARLVVCAWFNPMGPTLSTLELCTSTDGERRYLVEYMRHPFSPRYLVFARCDSDEELTRELPAALDDALSGGTPSMLTINQCPDDLHDVVLSAVRAWLRGREPATGEDLLIDAARLAATRGQPWEWASPSEATIRQMALFTPEHDDSGEVWLEQAGHPDNVAAVLAQLPESWDGALNYQMSQGNMGRGYFDTSPIFVTYSNLGTEAG